jgi:hypothetical protein
MEILLKMSTKELSRLELMQRFAEKQVAKHAKGERG